MSARIFTQRRGRGRGAGRIEPRVSDVPTLSGGIHATAAAGGGGPTGLFPHALQPPPQQQQVPLPQPQDALVQGWRPDGRPAATMLDACTDDEARAFCQLAYKLGLLDDSDLPAQRGRAQSLRSPPAFSSMDRQQLDKVLMKLRQLGEPAPIADAAVVGGGTTACDVVADEMASPGTDGTTMAHLRAPDDDTQSSNRGGKPQLEDLPCTAGGDYIHPYLRRILDRPCTAYVLNPSGGNGSLLLGDSTHEDDGGDGGGGLTGGFNGRGSRGGGAHPAKMTGVGGRGGGFRGSSVGHEPTAVPTPLAGDQDVSAGAHPAGLSGGGDQQQLDTPSTMPLHPQPPHDAPEPTASGLGAGAMLPAATPPASLGGPPSAGGGRGGRARNSVNYSALAGKKDKERERELREREREERERAKTVVPKFKRRPGPRGGASWSLGSGGASAAALAGLNKPLTNNPLALLNKVPLLFKDEPGSNATTAAVHAVVEEGESRQRREFDDVMVAVSRLEGVWQWNVREGDSGPESRTFRAAANLVPVPHVRSCEGGGAGEGRAKGNLMEVM